jgi:hypothetical protein
MQEGKIWDWIVIGGGAAGVFGAINLAKSGKKVLVLEKFNKLLSKLAISGGGRCNVTHDQHDPKKLINNYPRGSKELLGPFFHFGPKEMIEWLKNAGVDLKIEADGRMFPTTDSSSTIIDCFLQNLEFYNVDVLKNCDVLNIQKKDEQFKIDTKQGTFVSNKVLVATGSSQSMWTLLKELGHTIIKPRPSLFALNTPSSPFNVLSGLSLKKATVSLDQYSSTGPLLFTHFGLSGPSALKLSSFMAVKLADLNYLATIHLDFLPDVKKQDLEKQILESQQTIKQLHFDLPKRLIELLCHIHQIPMDKKLNHVPKNFKNQFIEALKSTPIKMEGKTTHKEEFVTSGGVDLSEIDFKTMQSKKIKNLYFAGEVLNIDGVTGGFNFQNAWTTSFLVAKAEKI